MKRPVVEAAAVEALATYLSDVWGARPLAAESDLDPVLLRALRGDRLRFEREAESGGEDPVWREAIRRRYDRPIPEGEGAVAAACLPEQARNALGLAGGRRRRARLRRVMRKPIRGPREAVAKVSERG